MCPCQNPEEKQKRRFHSEEPSQRSENANVDMNEAHPVSGFGEKKFE